MSSPDFKIVKELTGKYNAEQLCLALMAILFKEKGKIPNLAFESNSGFVTYTAMIGAITADGTGDERLPWDEEEFGVQANQEILCKQMLQMLLSIIALPGNAEIGVFSSASQDKARASYAYAVYEKVNDPGVFDDITTPQSLGKMGVGAAAGFLAANLLKKPNS